MVMGFLFGKKNGPTLPHYEEKWVHVTQYLDNRFYYHVANMYQDFLNVSASILQLEETRTWTRKAYTLWSSKVFCNHARWSSCCKQCCWAGNLFYFLWTIVGSSCFSIHKKPPTRFVVYLEELMGHFWKIKRLHLWAFCFLKCLYIYEYIYSPIMGQFSFLISTFMRYNTLGHLHYWNWQRTHGFVGCYLTF